MSLTIKLTQHMEVTIGGEVKEAGSKTVPVEIVASGDESFDVNPTLATATELVLWTAADSGMADFDFMWLLSDQTIAVELQTASDVTYAMIEVLANVPFILSTDRGIAKATSQFDGTIYEDPIEDIDQIEVRNDSGSTANIRLILVS